MRREGGGGRVRGDLGDCKAAADVMPLPGSAAGGRSFDR
jgi:hypothetical protein